MLFISKQAHSHKWACSCLKKWFEKGIRTAAEAMALDAPEKKAPQKEQPQQKKEMDRMKEYLQKLHGKS